MHSIAFRMVAEKEAEDSVAQEPQQRSIRRRLRDDTNPLELPESLVNKPAYKYLLDILITHTQQAKKQFAVSPVIKLSECLRFFAEGGYQTGVGKDTDVSLAQSTRSKVLEEVVAILEKELCSK